MQGVRQDTTERDETCLLLGLRARTWPLDDDILFGFGIGCERECHAGKGCSLGQVCQLRALAISPQSLQSRCPQ